MNHTLDYLERCIQHVLTKIQRTPCPFVGRDPTADEWNEWENTVDPLKKQFNVLLDAKVLIRDTLSREVV